MKKILFLSGKGGTGKTSIMSCLIGFFSNIALADCDVDASNLHLILNPKNINKYDFYSGYTAKIDNKKCIKCAKCYSECHFDAIRFVDNQYIIMPYLCEGCSLCSLLCPQEAVSLSERLAGHYFEAETSYGKLVYAELDGGIENSGKLVSKVKDTVFEFSPGCDFLLLDGPPGIACPTLAALNNINYVVLVTEPSVSALSDMKRLISLLERLNIRYGIILNKSDLNSDFIPEISEDLILGKIPYIDDFKNSINQGVILTELNNKYEELFKPVYHNIIKRLNEKEKL